MSLKLQIALRDFGDRSARQRNARAPKWRKWNGATPSRARPCPKGGTASAVRKIGRNFSAGAETGATVCSGRSHPGKRTTTPGDIELKSTGVPTDEQRRTARSKGQRRIATAAFCTVTAPGAESFGHYRGKLQQEREHLLAATRQTKERIKELDLAGAGQTDERMSSPDRECLTEAYARQRTRLNSVIRSIERIQEGTFGRCDNCNALIDEKRLNVMPSAQYCVTCQQELEQGGLA